MKKTICILLLLLSCKAFAQNPRFIPSGNDRYKQVAGRYGSSSGICLFDDGKFLLYGYATMVFGTYSFEKDYLNFYPDKQERFVLFATKHREIGRNASLYFQGFEEGSTYVQFGMDSMQRVFNPGANCFNNPYIYTAVTTPATITFFERPSEEYWYQHAEPNVWKFNIEKGYNSFMLFYNEPKKERQDFTAMIELVDGEKVLKLSNYGGDEGFVGHQNDEDDNNWNEILEMKRQYYSAFEHGDTLYANYDYNIFNIHENENYRYDEDNDRYVDILNKDNDSYYQGDTYNDSRFLKKFVKVKPVSKDSIAFDEHKVKSKTLFYTACDEEIDKGNHHSSIEDDKVSPAAIDETTTIVVDSVIADDFKPFEPFYVNLEDGFYEVKHANCADKSKTILATKPTLSKRDIESVKMEIDDRNIPIANIKFTSKAAIIFEQLTRKNINKPIAIVVNKKVITMPVIADVIKGGEVSISGGYTVEEIREIVKHLSVNK